MQDNNPNTLESKRQKIRKIKLIKKALFLSSFIIFLLAFAVSFFGLSAAIITPFMFLISFFMLAGGTVYHFCTYKKIKEFENEYKLSIMKPVFDKFITDCEFYPNMGIGREYIANLNAIRMGKIYRSEDYVEGVYNDVKFCRADILIQDITHDSDRNSHTVTYFRGQWMVFEFNKSFKKNIQIYDKFFKYANKGKNFFGGADKREKISFENNLFNNKFKVYANSQQEAFYIITPQIMESILNLHNNIKGALMLFFDDNKRNIAINNGKNSLEPSYKKDTSVATNISIKEAQCELEKIIEFIEQLKLNNDLYK